MNSTDDGKAIIASYKENLVLSVMDRKQLVKLILEEIKNDKITPTIFQKIDDQILLNFPSEEKVYIIYQIFISNASLIKLIELIFKYPYNK